MVEKFTPEIIAIAIVCLTALTLFLTFMVLVTIASLSRAKKHLLVIAGKCHELEEEQASVEQIKQTTSNNVAHLVELDDKIQSIEHHLDEFDNKIAVNQNRLTGYASKLKEYDTLFGQAGQMMSKEASSFNQAVQRIHRLEEELRSFQAFRRTLEQTRDRILDALGATPVETPPRNTPSTEQKILKEKVISPSEPQKTDLEDLYKSRMEFHYP